MSGWWVHEHVQDGAIIELVSRLFWVVLSITLHELGHGWAALRQGDDTPRRLGHMTANPLVHMGWMSMVVLAACGIAWGAMPVDPSRFRNRRWGDVIVSAAGPAMNLLLAALCLALSIGWLASADPAWTGYREVGVFLFYGAVINLILAPLNLLPIPPLDGSHILAAFSWKARQWFSHPNAPFVGLLAFMAIFFVLPFGGLFFAWAVGLSSVVIDGFGTLFGSPSIWQLLFP